MTTSAIDFSSKEYNFDKRSLQRTLFGKILRDKRNCPNKKFNILCLPGVNCWDIEYFSQFDRIAKIVALEKDEEGFEVIKRYCLTNSLVEVVNSDTTNYLCQTNNKFDLIYLDYFSNFNNQVEFDIKTIIERKLINEKGKLIVNFQSSRESSFLQTRNERYFNKLKEIYNHNSEFSDLSEDQKRACAVTYTIAQYRIRKIDDSVGVNTFLTTNSPTWYKYFSNGIPMITFQITFNQYTNKKCRGALGEAPKFWFTPQIKLIETKSRNGIAYDPIHSIEDFWMNKINKFYEQNHYTPLIGEITNTQTVKNWNLYLNKLDLCPRTNASLKQVLNELKRIEKRNGYVDQVLIKKAKLSKKKCLSGIDIKILCKQHKIRFIEQYEFLPEQIQTIKAWIEHLKQNKPKTQFQFYSWIRKHKLINIVDALNALSYHER